MRDDGRRGLAAVAALATLICAAVSAPAYAAPQSRTITYHGYSVTVPRGWPVYDLSKAPHTCVRFNRHALYLGTPASQQSCPARAVGRTEAILIRPATATTARAGSPVATSQSLGDAGTVFAAPSAGVEIVATWLHDPTLVAWALHRRSLPRFARAVIQPRLRANASGGSPPASAAAAVYTGPGFDACNVPAGQQMSAWTAHSPYRAIGVYIGGVNAACPPATDANLTPSWLAAEVDAGWHFIPTYVGLQAPSNSCSCAAINPAKASAEGTTAADDAVAQAQSLDLPSGTPIYNDMEYYSRTQTNTSAVLAFLSAWTTELHAKGYLSGVYGNANSAIADLVTQDGTSYPQPDDIWFAAWPGSGSQSTSDPNIPSSDWANHQRLHQYSGDHYETYGGVRLDIDGDYLDGQTAGSVVTAPPPPPRLSVSATTTGTTTLIASWGGLGLTGWEVLAGTSPTALMTVASAPLMGAQTKISLASAAPYFEVEALGSSGQVLATSATVAPPPRLAVFGRSSFAGALGGVGTLPVGCYLPTPCRVTLSVSVGRTVIARPAVGEFRSGGSGLIYYRLTTRGRQLLTQASGGRLPAQIALKDAGGASVRTSIVLVRFATSGRGPSRSLAPGPLIGAAGATDFFYARGYGGILVRCSAMTACWTSATLSVGAATIGTATPQPVGALELGYVFFSLSGRGRQLLTKAKGNQLGVTLVLNSGTTSAGGRIVLVKSS